MQSSLTTKLRGSCLLLLPLNCQWRSLHHHLIPPNIISSTTASLLTFRPSPQPGFSVSVMKLINLKSLSLSPKRLFRTGSSKRSASSSSSSASSSVHNPGSDGGVGVLTRRDLKALLGRLGAGASSQDEAEAMLREIGLGLEFGDGVGIEELVGRVGSVCGGGDEVGTASAMGRECEEELRRAFEFFDEDGDGRITAEELLGVFGGVMGDERCTLEDCRRMIAGVDRNRDGFVCFEDFTRMMELQIGA